LLNSVFDAADVFAGVGVGVYAGFTVTIDEEERVAHVGGPKGTVESGVLEGY